MIAEQPEPEAAAAPQANGVSYLVIHGRRVHGAPARFVTPEEAAEACWRGSFVMLVADETCALIHPGDILSDDEEIASPRVLHAGAGTELAAAAFVAAVLEIDLREST